jgi:hypothetical protein
MVKRVESLYNETRKFSGLEGSRFGECPAFERARILKMEGGKEIIYQQAYSSNGPYVLVPGYLVSEIITDKATKSCNVFPIKDECEMKYIKQLISAKAIGEVNFWN